MVTERLSMGQIREILRQKGSLGRPHREVAQSLGISSGASAPLSCAPARLGSRGAKSRPTAAPDSTPMPP